MTVIDKVKPLQQNNMLLFYKYKLWESQPVHEKQNF